jgi:sarcosine oxidase
MPQSFDVIVIGVGAMGSSACYHLAKRGQRVLGLEAFDIPHNFGSSHGHTRMTRTAYYEHPNYVALIHRANERWRELEAETGLSLLHHVGGIYAGASDGEVIRGSLDSARQHNLPHERLSRDDLARRFPQFNLPDYFEAVYEPHAGYLRVEDCVAAYAHAAMTNGARIHTREPVRAWTPDGTVTTDRDTYHADKIIFCSGSWTGKLMADLNAQLVVTRQLLAWHWPLDPAMFQNTPVWGIEVPGGLVYGFPMLADFPGLKCAFHSPGLVTDPDTVDRRNIDDDLHQLTTLLRRYVPKAAGRLLAAKTCLYTNSPDHHFIIGRHPVHARILLAAGFSGHGFKFASVVGELLCDLATTSRTRFDIDFLSPRRLVH